MCNALSPAGHVQYRHAPAGSQEPVLARCRVQDRSSRPQLRHPLCKGEKEIPLARRSEQRAEYLERVRAISKATGPDDFVFTISAGKQATTLAAN
jgi:hypothetical protein